MIILKKVDKGTDIRVAFHNFAFYPIFEAGTGVMPSGIPWPRCRENIRGTGYRRHNINFYRYRAMFRVFLPTVGEDARFDNLLDYNRWL